MDNKFSAAIPPAVLTSALQKIKAAQTELMPFLVSTTPEERRAMLKMGDKTLALVQKTAEYGLSNPEFAPNFFNLASLNTDLEGSEGLSPIENALTQLHDLVEGTAMLAGGEAYEAALMYYNGVKYAAAQNQPGAQAVYDDLKKRFPGRRTAKPDVI